MSEIEQALERIFKRHRIVLWYDSKEELQDEFEGLNLPGVEKSVARKCFAVFPRLITFKQFMTFFAFQEGFPGYAEFLR